MLIKIDANGQEYIVSSYIGVSYDKSIKKDKKWRARIRNKGVLICIGRYATEDEAKLAYDKKLLELNNDGLISKESARVRDGSSLAVKERSSIRMHQDNPIAKKDVKKKISKSLEKSWHEGLYDNRINGSYYNQEGYKKLYKNYIEKFQDITLCFYCKEHTARMIHHISEDHDNWLLTNIIPICDSCHQYLHRWGKTPFETVSKTFNFSASHHLENYVGKCFGKGDDNHGHNYELTIYIKRRVSWIDGMVIDFSELKELFNSVLDEKLDHKNINKSTGLKQSTVENLLIWIWKELEEVGLLKGLHKLELKENSSTKAELSFADMLEWRYDNKEWIPLLISDMEN